MVDLNAALWRSSGSYNRLLALLKGKNKIISGGGLVSNALPSLAAALFSENQIAPILIISSSEESNLLHKIANQIKRLLEQVSKEKPPVDVFPTAQVSVFEGLGESEQHFAKMSSLLSLWQREVRSITVCSLKSLLQPVVDVEGFSKLEITLKLHQELNLTQLVQKLNQLGYKRVDTVTEVGTFALRGEIMDIFPANCVNDLPVRLNFFGDEIEHIKPFEPWNQRSSPLHELEEIRISPLRPILLPFADERTELVSKLKSFAPEIEEAQRQFWQQDIEKFEYSDDSEGNWQRFIPWIHESFVSPLQYFPENALIIIEEPHSLEAKLNQFLERSKAELDSKLKRQVLPASQSEQLNKILEVAKSLPTVLEEKRKLELSLSEGAIRSNDLDFATGLAPQFRSNMAELSKYLLEAQSQDKKVWLSSASENDLRTELAEHSLKNISFCPPIAVDKGFSIENVVLLTDFELFAKKAVIGQSKKSIYRSEDFVPIDLDAIRPGDYLVHIKHGIGKFLKMKSIELEGKTREYITLEYQGGDLLNVPVDQMNLLTLYKGASEGQPAKVSRLGGIDWERTKKSVRTAVEKIAEDLVELYANRSLEEGFNFGPDTPWQTELEDSFPYRETPDQVKAVNEIKADMESGVVMDRLLCGDVGFGKTEVVIRTAFKAIMAGKQVAVLAPTTILAQQHCKSFTERFGKFPVRIELLTRAKTAPEKKEALRKISLGETDLVIGTHAILSKKVEFKDLGLIVIDEEQKFGVNHKEKLKKLQANVDVLTVSATPIPRTMHMALSGIREMSLISTPPPGRVPIRTQVMVENDKIIRAAILRELERGGQVFYLHNRIESIESKAIELNKLVPEASFRIAHGKMTEAEIADAMEAFTNRDFDVLIATSIIENGLDIPNANTMIIEDADKLGLGQLYQLRGRVGRSNDPSRPGYAILLHSPTEKLNESAKARLETISRYSNLGSGYQIALRDMEIRGVGNLLGQAQHGKVVSVGFELYCDMLNEAISRLKEQFGASKGEPVKASRFMSLEDKPVIDFKVNAYIPVDWIKEDTQRLREYQRLAEVNSMLQLNSLADEWTDRFGKLPHPVQELVKVVKLRVMAADALIKGVVRPIGNFVELNTKLDFAGWKSLQNELRQWIKDRLAVNFPTATDAKIMVKITDLTVSDQLELLEQLFKLLITVQKKENNQLVAV